MNGGAFVYNAGSISGRPPYLGNATLTLNAAAAAPANYLVAGNATLGGDIPASHTVWVQGNGSYGGATLTSASGFTNAGTLRVESVDAGYDDYLVVNGGAR